MKVLILLGLFVVASAFDFNEEWEQWKKDYGKDYKSANEEVNRHVIWETNKKRVELHNENKGVYGYTLAINEFADLDSTEFARMYNGYRSAPRRQRNEKPLPTLLNLPDSVDWRTKGYVTGVKNQGQCGSCWAFSTTGSVEGQHFNATGKLVSLSEQNLVDCSGSEGNEGCNGGLMDDAFEYIIKNGGIDTEESYPYKAEDERCRFKAANVGATISSYHDVPSENEKALQDFVATVGPISVAIDASHNSFQLYSSGVYYEPDCSETELDHGVLAVGYGTDGSKDYWLVKNSWGESWGMEGYIWMSRNRDNNCGIATSASFPIV